MSTNKSIQFNCYHTPTSCQVRTQQEAVLKRGQAVCELEHGPVEILSFPIVKIVIMHTCVNLPEGTLFSGEWRWIKNLSHASWALFWAVGLQHGSMIVDRPARVCWDASSVSFMDPFGVLSCIQRYPNHLCLLTTPTFVAETCFRLSVASKRVFVRRWFWPFPESTKMNGSSITTKLCIPAISLALEDNSFRKSWLILRPDCWLNFGKMVTNSFEFIGWVTRNDFAPVVLSAPSPGEIDGSVMPQSKRGGLK